MLQTSFHLFSRARSSENILIATGITVRTWRWNIINGSCYRSINDDLWNIGRYKELVWHLFRNKPVFFLFKFVNFNEKMKLLHEMFSHVLETGDRREASYHLMLFCSALSSLWAVGIITVKRDCYDIPTSLLLVTNNLSYWSIWILLTCSECFFLTFNVLWKWLMVVLLQYMLVLPCDKVFGCPQTSLGC